MTTPKPKVRNRKTSVLMRKQRTSKHEIIPLDSNDVLVEDIEDRMCTNCEDVPSTKRVWLDVRNLGSTTEYGNGYCDRCAKAIADSLRAALPAPAEIAELI